MSKKAGIAILLIGIALIIVVLLIFKNYLLPNSLNFMIDKFLSSDAKQLAEKIIKESEGLSSKDVSGKDKAFLLPYTLSDKTKVYAYKDTGGVWTIGWGTITYSNGVDVKEGDVITKAQADAEFNYEFNQKFNAIISKSKVQLTNGQLAALTSFAYNDGLGALFGSTLWKQLQSGKDAETVAQQFDLWVYDNGVKVNGLVNRRANEKHLFLS